MHLQQPAKIDSLGRRLVEPVELGFFRHPAEGKVGYLLWETEPPGKYCVEYMPEDEVGGLTALDRKQARQDVGMLLIDEPPRIIGLTRSSPGSLVHTTVVLGRQVAFATTIVAGIPVGFASKLLKSLPGITETTPHTIPGRRFAAVVVHEHGLDAVTGVRPVVGVIRLASVDSVKLKGKLSLAVQREDFFQAALLRDALAGRMLIQL